MSTVYLPYLDLEEGLVPLFHLVGPFVTRPSPQLFLKGEGLRSKGAGALELELSLAVLRGSCS